MYKGIRQMCSRHVCCYESRCTRYNDYTDFNEFVRLSNKAEDDESADFFDDSTAWPNALAAVEWRMGSSHRESHCAPGSLEWLPWDLREQFASREGSH